MFTLFKSECQFFPPPIPQQHERTFFSALDDNVCLDWSSDSQLLSVGSRDMLTRVFPVGDAISKRFCLCSMGAHSDAVMGTFFVKDSYELYTISANRQLRAWRTEVKMGEIGAEEEDGVSDDEESEEEDEEDDIGEQENAEKERQRKEKAALRQSKKKKASSIGTVLKYSLGAKHKLTCEGVNEAAVVSLDYHKTTRILVAGFDNGAFLLFEMPELNLIHQLGISDKSVASVKFNNTGDWIAFGCAGIGQLLVWEWQSETYIVKQQVRCCDLSGRRWRREIGWKLENIFVEKSVCTNFSTTSYKPCRPGLENADSLPRTHIWTRLLCCL